MEILNKIVALFARAPAWIPLALCPGLLLACAVLFTLFGGRRTYPAVAVALGAAAFSMLCCMTQPAHALAFAGLFASFAALCALLFLAPTVRRARTEKKRAPRGREERIYRTFREALTEAPDAPPLKAAPKKVCCFEEKTPSDADAGLCLTHALDLLERLRRAPLTPADRLEADVLQRSVEGCRGRALGADEARVLNDCLASVLKLTAKYRL